MLKIKHLADIPNLPISNIILQEITQSLLQPFSSEQPLEDNAKVENAPPKQSLC